MIEAGVCRSRIAHAPVALGPDAGAAGSVTIRRCNCHRPSNLLELHRKEACWAISNITAGNKDQIQSTIDANVIPPLVKLLKSAEFDIKETWAISCATSRRHAAADQVPREPELHPAALRLLSAADEARDHR